MAAPYLAVRKYCLWCCAGQSKEVTLCPVDDCSIYKWRFGGNPPPDQTEKPRGSRLSDIRAKCIDCSGGSWKTAKDCPETDCVLFQYRFGKNPALVGKRKSPFAKSTTLMSEDLAKN